MLVRSEYRGWLNANRIWRPGTSGATAKLSGNFPRLGISNAAGAAPAWPLAMAAADRDIAVSRSCMAEDGADRRPATTEFSAASPLEPANIAISTYEDLGPPMLSAGFGAAAPPQGFFPLADAENGAILEVV